MVLCCCQNEEDGVADKRVEVSQMEKKGLRRCAPPKPISRPVQETAVQVNVYSLLEQNKQLRKVGMGVYHCGVVVYGIEWGYGECVESANASGLFCVYPGQAAGTLYRTLFLGVTTHSPQQVDTILHRLENEWRSSDYHILNRNCNHFAQRFCELLSTVQKLQIPTWCNRAARVCNKLVPRRLATYVHRLIEEEAPKASPPDRSRVREIPESVIPRDWYLHPSISQRPRYVIPFESRNSRPDLKAPAKQPVGPSAGVATRTDSDASLNGIMTTPPISNGGPSQSESPAVERSLLPEIPLPLMHDLNEVCFFTRGHGVSFRNHDDTTPSAASQVSFETRREIEHNVQIESLNSQVSIAHVGILGSEEEHTEAADKLIPIDDSVQGGIKEGAMQEEEKEPTALFQSIHMEEMDVKSALARFTEEDATPITCSLPVVVLHNDEDDNNDNDDTAKEELNKEQEKERLVNDKHDASYHTESIEPWQTSIKGNKFFCKPTIFSKSLENNSKINAKKMTLKNLVRRSSYSWDMFSRVPQDTAGCTTTMVKDDLCLFLLQTEKRGSVATNVGSFSELDRKPPLGAVEMNTVSSSPIYSDPEGDDEKHDAKLGDLGSCSVTQEGISEEVFSKTKFNAGTFNPLLHLYDTPALRRNRSWPP
ncbi:hypothetical protein C3747_69g161 [Trypanosoma cruzi]|uniref:PPPDE domain-containing protein n=2 Tax=Trypanosoma cruzi TaxID=5693 RepID=Q4DFR6_TRYCC|nr:hypothetical protein, conserved [Trypanosoma cruzi]EAN91371.1 hypothetical protein, conserved [Trypanosoma cruzi]PWV10419.1 hypothetical protein C3747_69g161 [Trypanosoma cruzi]RNC58100.1 hypothetical protein TcCL_ESM04300 [Trypanosoma cruzi]|eukprot:XP_813222.1 hypothetical protein [Trypanosoma cruzi strain CL Brener]